MAKFAQGKYALAISDISGQAFPWNEMVTQWNGLFVHYSEFESKQPQLDPKPSAADPTALPTTRPQQDSPDSLRFLSFNPIKSYAAGSSIINVFEENHGRQNASMVRFRGPPQVTSAGTGGSDARNLQAYADIPTFDNVSDIDSVNGFTIALGQIDSTGNVTGATTSDPLTNPINYFYITSTSNATTGNVKGGFNNCSAGPVTLEVIS